MEQMTLWNGRVLNHHDWSVCNGDICPIHNPTDHEYRQYDLDWSSAWEVMVRRIPIPGGITEVIDPDEYKIRTLPKNGTLILENAAKCLLCKTRIVSSFRWDFVSCPCGNLSVDGGKDYLKRGFSKGGESWAEDSVIITENELRK